MLLSEQTAAHYCPIELGMVAGARIAVPAGPGPGDDAVTPEPSQRGVPGRAACLASVFLLDPQGALQLQQEDLAPGIVSPRCRYFLHLAVLHLQQEHGLFCWHNHLET